MAVDAVARAIAAGKVPVDAYQMAVAGGYTGTKEQFEQDMGNSGTNAANAADSAAAAAASATTAANAAGNLAPAYSASATYAVGDHVLYDGGYYVCTTAITTAEAWTAAHWTAAKVGPEITDLKTQMNSVENGIFSKVTGEYESISEGWRINPSTGLSFQAAGYKIIKYPVSMGSTIKIIADDCFQFQPVSAAPASGSSSRIGETFASGEYVLTVPENANWLLVSTPTVSNSEVYKYYSPVSLLNTYKKLEPAQISENYQLNDAGYAIANANYEIEKYILTKNTRLFVQCDGGDVKMQYQSRPYVSSGGQQYIIGDTIPRGYTGFLDPPEDYAILILSKRKADDFTSVYTFYDYGINRKANTDIYNEVFNAKDEFYPLSVEFEIGALNDRYDSAGEPMEPSIPSSRLRSKDFIHTYYNKIFIERGANIDWFLQEYDENFMMVSHPTTWINSDTYVITNPFIKIVLRHKDDSVITVNEAENVKLYSIPTASWEPTIYDNSTVVEGYRLRDDGQCVVDANYKITKYNIKNINTLYLVSNHKFQFQNTGYVPAGADNNGIIGNKGTLYRGLIAIPDNATWLIISSKINDSESGVYNKTEIDPNNNVTNSVNPVLLVERYIGHRGGGKTSPENTIPCLNQGLANGFMIFEIDIQFTSDSIPVVLHDTTINRTARNADGTQIQDTINISDITYAQAQEYDFGIWKDAQYAGTKIPKLDDVMLWAKKNGVCIECDISGTENMNTTKAEILYNIVKQRGMNGSVMFTAGRAILLLFSAYKDICVCYSNVGTDESSISTASNFLYDTIYTMCSVQYPYLTDAQVNYIHQYGMKAKAFTISSNATANSVWEKCVDKMILDNLYPNEIT